MASVSFFASWNMATQQTWFGTLTGATPTRITITDGFHTAIYTGQFTYPSLNDVAGVLQGFQQFNGSALVASVSGLSVDAHTATILVNANQLQTLFQTALAGNDSINGSSSSDSSGLMISWQFVQGLEDAVAAVTVRNVGSDTDLVDDELG
jgi:serralysin